MQGRSKVGHAHAVFEFYQRFENCTCKIENFWQSWSTDKDPTEQEKRGGAAPTGRTPENDAKSEEDSFLVL